VQKRADGQELLALMQEICGEPATMWGPSIIGFGKHHYVYESGREGDVPIVGFSPRKQHLVLYLMHGPNNKKLLAKLGIHKTSKPCLYINKLSDIDRKVLSQLISDSVTEARKRAS
jgi:hypothetical protein